MKYLTIGLCVLAVILCLCLLFAYLSDQYLDETEALLREAAQYFPAGDYDSILPLAREAQETWESHKGFFSSILSHSELEEVNYCFASMTAYAECGEMAELRDAYSRLLSMLEHLRSMDRPRYYNILSPIVNQFKFKG